MSRCRIPSAAAASRPATTWRIASTAAAGASGVPSTTQILQRAAGRQLHRDDRKALHLGGAEDVDGVRMAERGGELPLAEEPLALLVVAEPAAQDLHRDRAGRSRFPRPRRPGPCPLCRADGRSGTGPKRWPGAKRNGRSTGGPVAVASARRTASPRPTTTSPRSSDRACGVVRAVGASWVLPLNAALILIPARGRGPQRGTSHGAGEPVLDGARRVETVHTARADDKRHAGGLHGEHAEVDVSAGVDLAEERSDGAGQRPCHDRAPQRAQPRRLAAAIDERGAKQRRVKPPPMTSAPSTANGARPAHARRGRQPDGPQHRRRLRLRRGRSPALNRRLPTVIDRSGPRRDGGHANLCRAPRLRKHCRAVHRGRHAEPGARRSS